MVKKTIGTLLIILGLLALVTPFTPGSWLIFVGLEFLGVRILFWDKIKSWFQKYDPR
ncbi:MAG: PGPGW domain-containing protein [Patescibacteria group bacterium]